MSGLADELVRDVLMPQADAPGRRMRVFVRLIRSTPIPSSDEGLGVRYRLCVDAQPLCECPAPPTYRNAMDMAAANPEARAILTRLPLRQRCDNNPAMLTSLDQVSNDGSNPELPPALQDLAEEIAVDVHEACVAFDDPDAWYPGVDDGIAPVSDEHVRLVIAGFQRELSRERRDAQGRYSGPKLPPAPLRELPWRVQRALVERRRLRFAQYGIGSAQWRAGTWSIWDVRDDPDWVPRTVNSS